MTRPSTPRGSERRAGGERGDALEDDTPRTAPLPKLLTTRELAVYLGYRGPHAQTSAQRFVQRNGMRRYWRSARVSMVKLADVDDILSGRAVRKGRS